MDILVQFSEPVDIFHFIELKVYVEGILFREVELAPPNGLKQMMKDEVKREVVYV